MKFGEWFTVHEVPTERERPQELSRYTPITLSEAKRIARFARERGEKVYAFHCLLVTEGRTYWVIWTDKRDEELARACGVQTINRRGDFYWPHGKYVSMVMRWIQGYKKRLYPFL